MSVIAKPTKGEYPTYYENYFKLVDLEYNAWEQMQKDAEKFRQFILQIPEEKWHYAYADGKWTVLQVIQHVIDTERIMTYRALSFARGEQQSLPGFDENEYAKNASTSHKNAGLISLEWVATRQSTLSFYLGLTIEEAARKGLANQNTVSVNAIAFMTIAHARHHFNIIAERYLGN